MEVKNFVRKIIGCRARIIAKGQNKYNTALMCELIVKFKARLNTGGTDEKLKEYFREYKQELLLLMPANWKNERAKLEELLA